MLRTCVLILFCALLGPSWVRAAPYREAEVRVHLGRPMIFVDGKPNPMAGYCPIGWSRPHFVQGTERFYPHKMNYYHLMLPATHSELGQTQFWRGDEVSDQPLFGEPEVRMQGFNSLDESAELVLANDPDAYLMVRFSIDPPRSWTRLHPEQQWITEDGETANGPSLASDLYWEMAAKFSNAVVRHAESRPWADRIIGYVNLYLTEGTPVPVIEGALFDHSPPMLARWREFLRRKYVTPERLQTAHHDPNLTIDTVEVPKDRLRGPTPQVSNLLYWLGPKDNQPLRDYLELTQELYGQRAQQIYAAMRAGTDRKRVFVYDMFKQQMLGWNCGDFFYNKESRRLTDLNMVPAIGSRNVTSLWDTPGFDGILTPHDYQARGIGGIFQPEGIVDSAVLRGKVFICEMDQRTWVDNTPAYGQARNLREYEAITWRNLATALTRGFYFYWMDLSSDWYKPPEIQQVIARQVEVVKQAVNWPHLTQPGIAMILDDNAVLETNGSGNYENETVMWEQKMGLARCGVPYRIYLLEDLALPDFPPHRVYYFPNLYKVDEERLALLREKVFRDGNVVIWGPGSGISDGEKIGPESAERLTGFTFRFWPVNYPRKTLISNFEHLLTRGLPADCVIGGLWSYGPLLFPTEGTELGIAWTKNGEVIPGLAAKEFGKGARGTYSGQEPLGPGDYAAVFTSAVPLPADLWRNAARWAGAHVYCNSNDVLMADRTIVALHSLQSGEKRLSLPAEHRVYDVITGQLVAHRAREICFRMQAPETRVFRLETPR